MLWIWLAIIAGFFLLWYWIGELQAERLQADTRLASAIDKIESSVREMQSQIENLGIEVNTMREWPGYDDAQSHHTSKLPPLYPALYNENGIVPRVFDVRTGLARNVRDLEKRLEILSSDLGHLTEASQPVA